MTQRAISGITGPWRRDKNSSQETEPRPEARRKQAVHPSGGLRARWVGRPRGKGEAGGGGATRSMTHVFKL